MSTGLSVEDRTARDGEARERSRSCFSHPIAVEAGAGTGKTTTLVARVLTWCIGPGWENSSVDPADRAGVVLRGVVAITFTEAAAAEMAARITEGLSELEQGRSVYGIPPEGIIADASEQRRRAGLLLAEADRLSVSTIHSFCRRILASAPFEAGLHPDFTLDASGDGVTELTREVAQRVFIEACVPDHPAREALLTLGEYGVGPSELAVALSRLVQDDVPLSELRRERFGSDQILPILTVVLGEAEELAGELDAALAAVSLKQKIVHEVVSSLAWLSTVSLEVASDEASLVSFLEELRAELPTKCVKRLKSWAQGKFNVGETKAFSECADVLQERSSLLVSALTCLDSVDPRLFGAAQVLLVRMLAAVGERRRQEGLLVFGDLLSGATDLLANVPEILERVRSEIDQLLVDEFQDTNPVQCRLVRLLALTGPPESRPGLFIVGDPKQAIYGWRGADLAAYEGFLEEMGLQGGERVSLVVNRRSTRRILDEVDRVIGPVMLEERGLQPRFQSLLPARADADAPPSRFL